MKNISKIYGNKVILKNINLKINKGEFITVIGSSGCGKTTFLKLINGLIEPDDGKVYVEGNDISKVDKIALRRKIGYVIQEIGLFPHMTVRKNISYVPNLIKKENISVIHCNTPIGGALGRLCGKKTKHIKIFYTAHGFHFYKGAPLVNNCIYKPMEKYLAHYSDVIITMNEEDYHVAKTMKLRKSGHVYKVNGVGINTTDYQNININKEDYRNWLSLENDDFVCIAMGDLIKRKNYEMALRGIALCKNPKIHYLICGNGPEKNNLQDLAKNLGIREQVHFLGYRTDIKELLAISDCFLFTSLQEGLPRSLMEAMASGLPCIISDIRGNRDLIINNVNGYLIKSIEDCTQKLEAIISDKQLAKKMQVKNLEVIKKYDFLKVRDQINEIYKTELLGNE